MRERGPPGIELNEEQRHSLGQGTAVRTTRDGHDVVRFRADIYRRIKAVLETERAIIAGGHTRGLVAPPHPLEALALYAEERALPDVAFLPGTRYEEILALVRDDRERVGWHGAVKAAQESWAWGNPD